MKKHNTKDEDIDNIKLEKQEEKVGKESHVRSLVKGFTWRALGTLDTMMISWFVTGSIKLALSIGGIEIFTKVFLYYVHERIWQFIPRGTFRKFFKRSKK